MRASGWIARSERLVLAGCVLLVALVLGFAISAALYQVNREALRSSPTVGALLCGPGKRVDDVPAGRRARRLICRDEGGAEVAERGRVVWIVMALPFILLVAVPGLWFATRASIRLRRG